MNQEEDGKNARIKSSSNVDVINPPAVFPLVDAHMHIQSFPLNFEIRNSYIKFPLRLLKNMLAKL